MDHRFLHVGIVYSAVAPAPTTLEPLMEAASSDWVRYGNANWILWSNYPIDQLVALLRTRLGPQDQLLVAKLDMSEKQGWLTQWIWDWINKPRQVAPLQTYGNALTNVTPLGAPYPPRLFKAPWET